MTIQIETLQTLAASDDSLFAGLTPEELARCAEKFDDTEVLAGSTLTREGDHSYRFFVVIEGQVAVLQEFEQVATLNSGDCFGEMGVATDSRRNARVVATERSRVASMIGWDFREMCDEVPVLGDRIQKIIDLRTS